MWGGVTNPAARVLRSNASLCTRKLLFTVLVMPYRERDVALYVYCAIYIFGGGLPFVNQYVFVKIKIMASPKKTYRKTCNRRHCRKKYKGTKQQKYCCASCRVLECQARNTVKYYPTLKKILTLELSYLITEDITKVVECCLWSIQRWKKNKKDL